MPRATEGAGLREDVLVVRPAAAQQLTKKPTLRSKQEARSLDLFTFTGTSSSDANGPAAMFEFNLFAYERIADEEKRAAYDIELHAPPPPVEAPRPEKPADAGMYATREPTRPRATKSSRSTPRRPEHIR